MKQIILWALASVFIISATSCKKDMMGYEGKDGIYFAVQSGASYGAIQTWPYQPATSVEFVKLTQNEVTINLKVMITGPVRNSDRTFKVQVNPDSTTAQVNVHYKPIATELVVPANQVMAYIPVTLLRTPDLQTTAKSLGLKLVANENFELAFQEWDAVPGFTAGVVVPEFDASLHKININDFMVQPAVWVGSIQPVNRESGLWGAFSRKKIELMCQIMHLTYADFSSTTTMPSVLQNLLTAECAAYLIQKFNAKDPVLEDDGRLMFIGAVPWTSYIGVKWVP